MIPTDKQMRALAKISAGAGSVMIEGMRFDIPADVRSWKRMLLVQLKIADKILAIIAPKPPITNLDGKPVK